MSVDRPTIGILHPGEMGVAVAEALHARGYLTVASIDGRSARTAQRCRQAGIRLAGSLEDLVRESQVVISLVPPACAEEVAEVYCELSSVAPEGAIFVDANSIRPELAQELARRVESHGRGFVDAAINGLAKNLRSGGTLFLSGAKAPQIASLFEGSVRVQVLGDAIGRASAMKMLLAGVSKGICGLFVELALLARKRGMSSEFVDAAGRIYPGVMALVERMLPTYAQHAERRATEMSELTETALASALDPCILEAVRHLHDALAGIDYGPEASSQGVQALIDQLAKNELLNGEPLAATDNFKKD